jgi:hypothetical protein
VKHGTYWSTLPMPRYAPSKDASAAPRLVVTAVGAARESLRGASTQYGAGAPWPVEQITQPHPGPEGFVEAASGLGLPVDNGADGGAESIVILALKPIENPL